MSEWNKETKIFRPICRLFQAGNCHFGSKCKFSHSIRTEELKASLATEQDFRQWKRLLSSFSRFDNMASQFFQLGLSLVDGDPGIRQEIIKLLSSEEGLRRVRELTDVQIVNIVKAQRSQILASQLLPFFRLISHSNVINSMVLEQEVASIYNFLIGVGGVRLKRLFSFFLELLEVWPSNLLDKNITQSETLAVSLLVLSKIIEGNTTTIVMDSLIPLIDRYKICLQRSIGEDFSQLQAKKCLEYMQRRLGIGQSFPIKKSISIQAIEHSGFILPQDLPGTLSKNGPRHDNDNADISKIKILPTFSEIKSIRPNYLPVLDSNQWHLNGIQGLLDRHFRLLREDTIGQLRDAVSVEIEILNSSTSQISRPKNGIRTYTYNNISITDIKFNQFFGLEFLIEFDQPSMTQKLSKKQREIWWMNSKRLQQGALVCLVDRGNIVVFCSVTIPKVNKNQDQQEANTNEKTRNLFDHENSAYITLQTIEQQSSEIRLLSQWFLQAKKLKTRSLVEFPGILLPSFQPTLLALQRMSTTLDIPFIDILSPSPDFEFSDDIPPPAYTIKPGFRFNLKCLTSENRDIWYSPNDTPNISDLCQYSPLDESQAYALLNSLRRSVALIQGPPGTGKSFTGEALIKVLLANKASTKIGPILCVCYTNHALDQLLVHLLKAGIKKIIRIGSRSKAEELEEHNLRIVARSAETTRAERSIFYELKKVLLGKQDKIVNGLDELKKSNSMNSIQSYLEENFPHQFDELFPRSIDGWIEVDYNPERIIERWLKGGDIVNRKPRSIGTLLSSDLLMMSHEERRIIHGYWLKNIRNMIIDRLVDSQADYLSRNATKSKIRSELDLRCLQESEIIGVTTTGLAKNLDLLRKIHSNILLCEEAGEVLEAHILTALLPSIEHVIFIGDHLQLRPQIQNYALQSTNSEGAKYSLDMSLFERLVNPSYSTNIKLPFCTLETQRRMHPSISQLIRTTLYPNLQDGENVMHYPSIVGMKRRLFWFDHTNLEAKSDSQLIMTSHSNDFEIEMVTALVSHLIRQGIYEKDDIAILTPYLGQLQKLRKRLQKSFEICVNDRDLKDLEDIEARDPKSLDILTNSNPPVSKTTVLQSVRVATVDNFQGEEAKVVIISLVRSNEEKKCGFLSTSNRINVLLSRAQAGMYIIGNSSTSIHVPMWAQVIKLLRQDGNFGTELELECSRHPNTPIYVSNPDHFLQFSPEGGCNRSCDQRLHCGHSCIARCHSEVLHNSVKCLEPCPRLRKGCDHPCPKACGDICEQKCVVPLNNLNITLPCGHIVRSALCWQAQNPLSIKCKEKVDRIIPVCKHEVKIECHIDVYKSSYRCDAECGFNRECGHSCTKLCFQCKIKENGELKNETHGPCMTKCGRDYTTCHHDCMLTCHDGQKCPPCSQDCEVRCNHSKCSKKCFEPCVPCAQEDCASHCLHSRCTMPCAAPCDWVPCSKRCPNQLSCGHQCPSICGELCPSIKYCQECTNEEIKDTVVDFLEMKQYREIDLDEDPCIFPDCGHFLTRSNMDGQMEMANYYLLSEDGEPLEIRNSSEPFSQPIIKVCATCRGSLRNISRYGRIVRRGILDESTKKFIIWSNNQFIPLGQSLIDEQISLSNADKVKVYKDVGREGNLDILGTRKNQIVILRDWVRHQRYDSIVQLRHRISRYLGQVKKEEQPFQRVADLVQFSNNKHKMFRNFIFDESVIQVRGYLQATTLLLRCDITILLDYIELRRDSNEKKTKVMIDLSTYIADCENLIRLAKAKVYIKEEIQGHIFSAQLYAIAREFAQKSELISLSPDQIPFPSDEPEKLKLKAQDHLRVAGDLISENISNIPLLKEMEVVETMLRDSVFYSFVSEEERRAVYHAMAAEFSGSGHWYTCTNGHPFTIGECGRPTEEAQCNECGAPVGGQGHVPVNGVTRAIDMEILGREVEDWRI